MTKLEALYAVFPCGHVALVCDADEATWFRLPGGALRRLKPGIYDLDMTFVCGLVAEELATFEDIGAK